MNDSIWKNMSKIYDKIFSYEALYIFEKINFKIKNERFENFIHICMYVEKG